MQMHATFWHLVHFAVVALLCLIWAPGELFFLLSISQDVQRSADSDSHASLTLSLPSDSQPGKWD